MTPIPVILKRRKGIILLVCGVLALAVGWAALPAREPIYKGHTMSEWVTRARAGDGSVFKPTAQVRDALLVIGANNLALLVHLISYDPQKSRFIPLFRILPLRINQMSVFDSVTEDEEHRNELADNAEQVFRTLGPLGAPAVPQLSYVLRKGGMIPGFRALHALDYVGEKGIPEIISAAALTNCATRFVAIRSLWAHTNSAEARAFLTKALDDPDPHVREDAAEALRGKELY